MSAEKVVSAHWYQAGYDFDGHSSAGGLRRRGNLGFYANENTPSCGGGEMQNSSISLTRRRRSLQEADTGKADASFKSYSHADLSLRRRSRLDFRDFGGHSSRELNTSSNGDNRLMERSKPQLQPTLCRERQQRLLQVLQQQELDAAIVTSPENVQYLTGFRPHRLMVAAVCLTVDGQCVLAAPNSPPEEFAADVVETFPAQWLSTLRQEQPAEAAAALSRGMSGKTIQRCGVEFSHCGPHLQRALGPPAAADLVDLDAELWTLRRRKDADELAMIRQAVQCTTAMYHKAKEIIEPGISELEVFNQLHAAAVQEAGEPLTALGNDYQCGSPGGPPRDRKAESGELYILDVGPAFRGYYADNCRTFAVNGTATDVQQQAWEAIVSVLEMVQATVRPGVSCRDLYRRAKDMLDAHLPDGFFHHLGHGFGLFPHEGPHLNPNWDDTFREGDVFTAEPGLYGPDLRAGIRLEENYYVTADGVERLTTFPLEL